MTNRPSSQYEDYAKRVAARNIKSITPFYKAGRFYISIHVLSPEPTKLCPSFAEASNRDLCVKELLKCKSASSAESTP